jgi:hypothetical protein
VYNQRPGLGFPLTRLGAVISRACGAVVTHGAVPRAISFTGALQTLAALQPLLALRATGAADQMRLYRDLLAAIATHRVGDRPDRYEPRLKKRRWNHYDWLTRPRAKMKRQMAKGVTQK